MQRVWELAKGNLALVTSGVLVVFACLKILAAAGFHTDTALLILAVTDRVTVLTSSIFQLLVFAALLLVANRRWRRLVLNANVPDDAPAWQFYTTWVGAVILPGLLLIVVSLPVLVGLVVGIVVAHLFRRVLKRRLSVAKEPQDLARHYESVRGTVHWLGGALVASVLVGLLLTPWVPLERVTLASGEQITGRVFGEQVDRTFLIGESDIWRGPRWVVSDEIA